MLKLTYRLFRDYYDDDSQDISAKEFLRELLATFRLLFGQDKRSWNLCKAMFRKQTRVGKFWKTIITRSKTADFHDDPPLQRLCCHDANYESLYDDVHISDIWSLYSAHQDCHFFGQRLLALQEYIRSLQLYDTRTLWYDRRDTNRVYTIWSVIVFSLVTILLSLLGLPLAAAQVVGSFR